jgi:4-diphosphocytidyl-2-C-methyl-D-erythritol kinase
MTLRKRIPPASGLGGASSDAAAVIRGIQRIAGERLPPERLLHIAAELGSDVPFFLVGGRAVGVGRGEEVYPLPDTTRCWLVVLFPGVGMATAEAYRLLGRPRLTGPDARPTIESFCAAAMQAGNASAPLPANDFEPLLLNRLPQLATVKRVLLRGGAAAAALSGSGSALFGLFEDRANAALVARKLRSKWQHVWLARTVSRREFQAWPASARAR